MSKLEEIEAATEALPLEQKQELLLFLVTQMRAQRAKLPEPRMFSREQMTEWISEDESDMAKFRDGK